MTMKTEYPKSSRFKDTSFSIRKIVINNIYMAINELNKLLLNIASVYLYYSLMDQYTGGMFSLTPLEDISKIEELLTTKV